MKVRRSVYKQGQSLLVSIPKALVDLLEIKAGDQMEYEYKDGIITLKKADE